MRKRKTIIARMMSAIMVVTLLMVSPWAEGMKLTIIEEYDASVTVDDAINWVKSKVGQTIEADGSAVGSDTYAQCVDLVKAYCDYLGVTPIQGNAIDYTTTTNIPEGWVRIEGATPQKGDILLYTGGVNGYGHVGIFESANSTYHQNVDDIHKVINYSYKYNTLSTPYWGVIRPNFSTTVTPTSVTLNKTTATLTSKGTTTTLTATVSPSNATDTSVTWKSSNTSVATVSSSGKVTAVANGTATITATTNSGGKTATCKVTVAIPTAGSDGWYYTDSLPSSISSSKYEIQYKNTYIKYATSSPGSAWTDTGNDKKEYTKSGSTYEKAIPITTSDTVQLDHYYYYHFCSGTVGNYEQTSTYTHYDEVSANLVYESGSYADGNYTYYRLKWNADGTDAYCCSAGYAGSGKATCDGSNGEHGNRTYYWYKMYVYQNYTVKTLNEYKKVGDWSTTKDSSATSVTYRYRLMPTGVSLNKTSATLTAKGATVTLTPTIAPSNAGCTDVTWKSSNTSVATVSSSGVVTAVGNGTATITATTVSGSKTATCKVTVSIAATGVSLNKTSATLTSKGATVQLTATVSPSNAANKTVTWKSSNTSVATVSSSGLVTAVGNGTATITVITESGSKTATCKITVSIATTGVSLNKSSETLTSKGATVQLTATVSPSNAANKNVTWKSSNTSVATVSSSGLVTAVGNGTATITVTTESGNKTATCKITVSIAATGISLNKTSATLTGVGATEQLVATVTPSNAADKTVTWKTSDSTVATVSNGKITAVAPGTATITATCGKYSASCSVTIKQPLTGIVLSETKLTMNVGTNETLSVTYNPSNTTDSRSITWTSSNSKVATVQNGKITAVAPGTVTITATCGSKTATCSVTVIQPLSGISVSSTNVNLNVGEVQTITVIYNEENTTDDKVVTWKSSDLAIATVENGKITAINPGTVIITATCGKNSATCEVTVSQPLRQITLSETNKILEIGQTLTLKVSYNPGNTTDSKQVVWSSDNESVAMVVDGKVTAKGAGSATITAVCGNIKATCVITVEHPLDNLTMNTPNLMLDGGAVEVLKVVYNAGGVADDVKVTWKSSNPKVVTVNSDGEVTAVGSGVATVIAVAEDGTEIAACEVTVAGEETQETENIEPGTDTEGTEAEGTEAEGTETEGTEIEDIDTETGNTASESDSTKDEDSEYRDVQADNDGRDNALFTTVIVIGVICAIGIIGVIIVILKKRK